MTNLQEFQLVEQKDLRDKILMDDVVEKVNILNKVKSLLLIPEMEVMTTKMIADYYEVDMEVIQKCYQRNKEEMDLDGVKMLKILDFNDMNINSNSLNILKTKHNINFKLSDEVTVIIPNCGIKGFSKRAILRIGMLLRDSNIAKVVRTQLLNVFEHSTTEQKVFELDEERKLMLAIGEASINGTKEDLLEVVRQYNNYRNRYVKKIELENVKLSNVNKELETENNLLTRVTLEWGDREVLNALIRKIATKSYSNQFGKAWNDFYTHLNYKLGINVKSRAGTGSFVNRLTDKEIKEAIVVAVAMCKKNDINVVNVINEINTERIGVLSCQN